MTRQRGQRRCEWATSDPLLQTYHDTEWGTPLFDDRRLFEFVVLDGMQAGLSWMTILRKRENFRRAFDDFDPEEVARYGPAQVKRLLSDAGIIRNRLKITAAIANARAYLTLKENRESFSAFLWDFVGGCPIVNRFRTVKQIPTETKESRAMSKALQKQGFKFVGPTICYAFMQAAGMVNDHLVHCYRHRQVQKRSAWIGKD